MTASNSLFGTTTNDAIGGSGIYALAHGNYVVASYAWNNGTPNSYLGAATWGDGINGTTHGPVSVINSLYGTTLHDDVGIGGITALSNGNYVVNSKFFGNGVSNSLVGASTWGNGASGIVGPLTLNNSLIGSHSADTISKTGTIALTNGNYVVITNDWNSYAGAVTWGNGSSGATGVVSASNSLISADSAVSVGDGFYVSMTPTDASAQTGGATFADGRFGIIGTSQAWNTAVGASSFAYDAPRKRLIAGKPKINIVTLFTMDQIFAGRFE